MTSHETQRSRRISLNSTRCSPATAISTRHSKRSPSPIVLTPGQLAPDSKTVQFKDITRQVFKSLEGFGYMDFLDIREPPQASIDEDEEEEEVSSALSPNESHVASSHIPHTPHITKPKKIDWEIPRKVLHSSIGFGTLYLYLSQDSPRTVIIALWSALAIIIPADIIRFRSPRFEKTYERALGFLMRESEKGQVNGVIWYILGVNFALTFYPLDVAVVAILILSWADTAASTIGKLWGSKTPGLPQSFLGLPFAPRKSLAGFIAACVTGASIAVAFWGWVAPMRSDQGDITWFWEQGVRRISESPISEMHSFTLSGALGIAAIGIVAGVVSGVAEALDLPGALDDNLTLPIISGGCLYLFFKCLSYFAPASA